MVTPTKWTVTIAAAICLSWLFSVYPASTTLRVVISLMLAEPPFNKKHFLRLKIIQKLKQL